MGNYKHDCTSNFSEACRGECRETSPPPQKFVDEAKIIHHALFTQRLLKSLYGGGWKDVKVAQEKMIIQALQTSHDEGVNGVLKVLPAILDEQFGITLRNTTDLTEGVIEALIDNVVQAIRQRSSK